MNKEELLKEFNEKVEQLRDEFISKLEDDKKEFEIKLPYKYDTLYFFDFVDNEIYMTGFSSSEKDITRFLHGYYFKTREEVEQHLKECKLLFKIKKWAEIHNEGWQADWSVWNKEKYTIYHSGDDDKLKVWTWNTSNIISILPYFKTREIAQECIDTFGDEIKEVLC